MGDNDIRFLKKHTDSYLVSPLKERFEIDNKVRNFIWLQTFLKLSFHLYIQPGEETKANQPRNISID